MSLIDSLGRTIFNSIAWYHDRRMPAPAQRCLPESAVVSHLPQSEICDMNRKGIAFVLSAGMLVLTIVGASLSRADDKEEGPLEKLMEKVNKANAAIQKGTRNQVNFKKSQKDVAKNAKELAKLGKEAKLIKTAVKNAKDVTDPDKKWTDLMDDFIKTSTKLGEVAGKTDAVYTDAKDAFGAVKKSCADCHAVFKVEDKF
jgi:cytochrome c556